MSRKSLSVDVDCPSGKIPYRSKVAAERGQAGLKKQGRIGLQVYECRECQYWHLGHKGQPIGLLFAKVRRDRNIIKSSQGGAA